jgi:uncharacterized protein YcfJ
MKTLLATVALISAASTASAETRYANITQIQPNYQTVYNNVPTTQCQDVEVPIYGTIQGGGASGADVLGGMIIGGLLGKGVTGKDDGAAAGAVLGGIIAADKGNQNRQVITGYRIERQCTEVMHQQQQRKIKNYTITYRWNGITGQSYTYNNYRVGDRIPVTVSINAN